MWLVVIGVLGLAGVGRPCGIGDVCWGGCEAADKNGKQCKHSAGGGVRVGGDCGIDDGVVSNKDYISYP